MCKCMCAYLDRAPMALRVSAAHFHFYPRLCSSTLCVYVKLKLRFRRRNMARQARPYAAVLVHLRHRYACVLIFGVHISRDFKVILFSVLFNTCTQHAPNISTKCPYTRTDRTGSNEFESHVVCSLSSQKRVCFWCLKTLSLTNTKTHSVSHTHTHTHTQS